MLDYLPTTGMNQKAIYGDWWQWSVNGIGIGGNGVSTCIYLHAVCPPTKCHVLDNPSHQPVHQVCTAHRPVHQLCAPNVRAVHQMCALTVHKVCANCAPPSGAAAYSNFTVRCKPTAGHREDENEGDHIVHYNGEGLRCPFVCRFAGRGAP